MNAIRFCVSTAAIAGMLTCAALATRAQAPVSHPEEIEWTWEVRPPHPDAKLPNVLLVGDSISRNYYPEVQRQLEGAANVYLLATSASVGDPRLPSELAEFSVMEGVQFKVVHLNNGLHGWSYSEAEYRTAFPGFLAAIHAIAPGAQLVWATSTPVRIESNPGPTNLRINARNAIAMTYIGAAGIAVDDQHALMMQHQDTYQDNVHFNDAGSRIQGKQAAEGIFTLLQTFVATPTHEGIKK